MADAPGCALITITQKMFQQSGSNESECDGIASLPRKIEGVLVGVTLRERKDGTYKVSLRTYAPIDASYLCSKMGGGGHARAAGCACAGRTKGNDGLAAPQMHRIGGELNAGRQTPHGDHPRSAPRCQVAFAGF